MLWLQRHSTATLYGTFAITIVLMIFCLITFYYYAIIDINRPEGSNSHPFYVTEYSLMFCIFFGTANAMVIFRMFSLNMITFIMHALVHLVVVICLIVHLVLFNGMTPVKSFYHTYSIQIYIILAVYVLQCLIALDLIIFKPGKTHLEREKRSGLHAFFGVVTFVVMFWNMMLMISMLCINPEHTRSGGEKIGYGELLTEPSFLIVFLAIYMLLILFILLTPFFRSDARELITTEEEGEVDRDYAELNAQFLQARYLYEKENEDESLGLEKKKFIPRQNMMVLTVSQTSAGGRRHRTPQNSRVDQMKYRLEEVWQDDRVVSQTSLEESSCRSPPPTKCPPLKRVAKIRRRRAASPQCPCPINKEPTTPKCGCSKPCQSPSRCRSRSSRGPAPAPPRLVKRSCSQMDLAATSCRRSSPKSSSAPCNKLEEDNWHHLSYEKPSQTSFEGCNLCGAPLLRADSGGSRLKTTLTSPMNVDPNVGCSCSKTISSDDKDIPFGICSTASQIDLSIDRSKCSKKASRNKMQDLTGSRNAPMTPPMRPVRKCTSCGKCSITLQVDKADAKPKCSKVPTKSNLGDVLPVRKSKNAPPMKCIRNHSPIGKFQTPPRMQAEDIRRGRYFLAPLCRSLPQKKYSDGDIQFATDPPTENQITVPQSETVSIPSQTDFVTDQQSAASQTEEQDREEITYSRLSAAPSSSFKYTEKPIISEKVPTLSRERTLSESMPDTRAYSQRRSLSAPANLLPFADKPKQSDQITTMPAKERDSTKDVRKSINTQPIETATNTSQTDFTKDTELIANTSLKRESSRDRWKPVTGLHGMYAVKTPQRRSSLRSSTELTAVDLRDEVVTQPLPEEKVKDAETKRKNSRFFSRSTNESIQSISAVKTTSHSSPKKLSREPSIKNDRNSTSENNSVIEKASSTAKPMPDSSLKPRASSSGLVGLAVPIQEPIENISKAQLTRDNSLHQPATVDSNLPRIISADRSIHRTSIVDFNLSNSVVQPDAKQASLSTISRNSHGSSSTSGSSDSMIDSGKHVRSKSR